MWIYNKCIGDDTKATAHQSLNCIKNKNKIKYGEKLFSIWQMEFLHPAMWHDHDIDFARWLHPAMWHVALESWQWTYQVAAPCNVIRGSGMTCHWICPVAAPCNVTCSSGIMTLNSPSFQPASETVRQWAPSKPDWRLICSRHKLLIVHFVLY